MNKPDSGESNGMAGNSGISAAPRTRWTRIVIVVFALVCALEILAGFELYRRVRLSAVSAAHQEVSGVFRLKMQQITSWREERLADADFVARARFISSDLQRFLAEATDDGATPELGDWLTLLKRDNRYAAAVVYDRELRARKRIPEDVDIPESWVRSLFDEAVASGQAVISDLRVDEQSGRPKLDVMVPIRASDAGQGQPFAAVLLRLDPEKLLFPLIQSWPTQSRTAETLLVRKEGDEILYLNELRHRSGSSMKLRLPMDSPTLPAARALRGESGTLEGIDYRGIPVVYTGAPVPGTTWAMIAKVDKDELYAPIRRQTVLAVLVIGLVVLATACVGTIVWQQREAGLRARLSLQGAALEAAANSVVMTRPDGTIEWINPAFTELTGYSAAEAVGKKPNILKSGVQDNAFYQQLWDTIIAGRVWHGEIVNRRKDGGLYTEEMTITPVKGADGRIAHFVGIKQNVTRRKAAEQALARMRDELEELVNQRTALLRSTVDEMEHFSYSITHDMRAPLRAMNAYASMLEQKMGQLLTPEAIEFVDRIKAAAVRLDNLIRDSLNYSKVLRTEMPRQVVDVGPLLRGIVETYPNLHGNDVEVTIEFQSARVWGNEAALTQCFSNLLGNAVKFVPADRKPQVRVTAEERATEDGTRPTLRLLVHDNGIGIAAEHQHAIFEMFTRLHGPDDYPGTGIGLAIVAKTIRRLGGNYGVISAPGKGSVFWIELEKAGSR